MPQSNDNNVKLLFPLKTKLSTLIKLYPGFFCIVLWVSKLQDPADVDDVVYCREELVDDCEREKCGNLPECNVTPSLAYVIETNTANDACQNNVDKDNGSVPSEVFAEVMPYEPYFEEVRSAKQKEEDYKRKDLKDNLQTW